MDRVQDASMVQFDMGSPVEVMVKKNNGMIHEVDIRPQARKVQYVQIYHFRNGALFVRGEHHAGSESP